MHRAAIESIFGLRLQAHELRLRPCLPSHWPEAELTLTREGRTQRFILVRAAPQAALAVATASLAGASAQILLPDQTLALAGLAAHTCFVIPLP